MNASWYLERAREAERNYRTVVAQLETEVVSFRAEYRENAISQIRKDPVILDLAADRNRWIATATMYASLANAHMNEFLAGPPRQRVGD